MIAPVALVVAAVAAAQPIVIAGAARSTASVAADPIPDKGYVVRVDSDSVWLDLTAADGAVPGRAFEIYSEGEELKHPVTGVSLGRVQSEIAGGVIKDVSDKFSTGWIGSRKGDVKAGQRARFAAAAPPPAAAAAPARPGEPEPRAPTSMGATVPYEVAGMAVGDYDRIKRPQIVLASSNAIRLYSYPMTDAKPLAELTLPGTGLTILGIESGDLDGDGGDELFVSVFNDAFQRFETRVYGISNGKWLKIADLPFLTRAYQNGTGARVLATQQITDDSFPFAYGAIYPLAYQDGKYVQGRPRLQIPRVDWLYEFTTAQIGSGAPAVLYLTTTHRLRVQFGAKWWVTPDDDYGQTPLRLRWKDKLLEFNPPIIVSYGPSGFDAVYAVRNMAALGGLGSPFGVFNHSELVGKRWNGLGLETAWKADLSGCAQSLALVETGGRKELAVAIRGAAGQSSVWTFAP